MENTLQISIVMVHEQLTRRIIGCAMQVHKTLKSGFQEVIYQRALVIEFQFDGLQFEREQEMEFTTETKVLGRVAWTFS